MNTSNLRRVEPDLWETSADHPAPGLHTHAYVWRSPAAGNVLFYSVATDRDFGALDAIGGIAHQYLSHRDEAGPMLDAIARRFGSRLHAPEVEASTIGRHRQPDAVFGAERTVDGTGITVVPTPGHSPGSTCFVVEGDAGRYLFTGDTLYRTEHGWAAGYLPGISDAGALLESLDVIATIDPDLVASSAFVGDDGVHRVDRAAWRACVDDARRRLESDLASDAGPTPA